MDACLLISDSLINKFDFNLLNICMESIPVTGNLNKGRRHTVQSAFGFRVGALLLRSLRQPGTWSHQHAEEIVWKKSVL